MAKQRTLNSFGTPEPWQIPLEKWKIKKGYEPFVIFGDYSPSQWAMMSKRTQSQILRRHEEDQRKRNRILEEHRNAVLNAFFAGKNVPKEVLRPYEESIEKYKLAQQIRQTKEEKEKIQYHKALSMKKLDFGKLWGEMEIKESPQLKNFAHVLRKQGYEFWRASHGEEKGIPKYTIERVRSLRLRFGGK